MKSIFRVFLICLFLIFSGAFFIQTPFAKRHIKTWIVNAAKQHALELEIDTLEGDLPFQWTFHDICLNLDTTPVYIETLHVRFAVFSLLKKQLEVTYLKAIGAKYGEVPFEVSAKGRVDLEGKKPIKLTHFLIEGDEFFVRLEGKVQPDSTIQEGHVTFHFPDLSLFGGKGSAIGKGTLTKNDAHFDGFSQDLFVGSYHLENTSFSLDAKRNKSWWEGSARFSGGPPDLPLNGSTHFRFTPSCQLLSLETIHIDGPDLNLFGKIDLDPSLKCLEGTLFAKCGDLKVLRPLFPHSYLKGRIGAKIDFQSFSNVQDIKCQVEVEDFEAYDLSCAQFTLEGTLYDLFGDLRGEISAEALHAKVPQMELSNVAFKSSFEPHASPFEFVMQGTWKEPLEVSGKGHWQKRGKGIFINMEDLIGSAFNKPFSLRDPFSLEWNSEHFKMSHFSLDIAQGSLTSRIDLTKTSSLLKIKAEEFPLEFITLPYKHFSLEGIGSLDLDLVSWENNIQGNCNIALKRALLRTEGAQDVLTTKGSMQVHLSGNIAQIHGELKAKDTQFFHFFAALPIHYQHFPFQVSIDRDKPLSGELLAEGKLEDLFNFINIGSHRLEGWLSTNLYFSQNLCHPCIQGSLELQDGLYENYYTGTFLQHIAAKADANKQTITITDLHASDKEDGTVSATANLILNPAEHFPYSITADLDELDAISFDTISGQFSGRITISGDNRGAQAKGSLKVAEATFRIPDQLPSVLPELPITFVNPPESITRKTLPSPTVAPLLLDLQINAPQKVYVEGRGIHAELKGKLHLTGTYTDIVANGTLQLVTGEYIFSGKVFNLTTGELIFNDKPTPSAYISLTGMCALPDVDVTVALRGPLSAPKLSFQSSPQLSTSELLAQILFNKDISEISAVQALQVAQTVISLSGNSAPDILEKIRKTLGIDRLTLVTSENDPGKISLQIGKYLMRGVLLTLSQGRESRNVTVEVDLKKGVSFQAEVNEDRQGKFSLKWHHHY